jgi:hypothetical protein
MLQNTTPMSIDTPMSPIGFQIMFLARPQGAPPSKAHKSCDVERERMITQSKNFMWKPIVFQGVDRRTLLKHGDSLCLEIPCGSLQRPNYYEESGTCQLQNAPTTYVKNDLTY